MSISFKNLIKDNYIFGIIILVIILLTVLTTFVLFPPLEEIPLEKAKTDEPIYISEIKTPKPSFKTAFADALQISLNLKWYDIYIVNKNTLESVEECPNIEQPYLIVMFEEGSPEKYLDSSFDKIIDLQSGIIKGFDDKTKVAHIGEGDYVMAEVSFNSESRFTYLGTDGFTIKVLGLGCLDAELSLIKTIEPDYDIYAKPNGIAWWTKFIIILLFWIIVVASLINIWQFSRKHKE